MLRKFLDGLAFGFGFSVAVGVAWAVSAYFVLPSMMVSYTTDLKEPIFENPSLAVVSQQRSEIEPERREFSFFGDSDSRMSIPPAGGLLSMSLMTTPQGSLRPRTYQLWLTESELWQIRTTEEKAEIEELPYPVGASADTLDEIMNRNLGIAHLKSIMTVSADEIAHMKSSGASSRSHSLNGKLKLSTEGVVFIIPDPYE